MIRSMLGIAALAAMLLTAPLAQAQVDVAKLERNKKSLPTFTTPR